MPLEIHTDKTGWIPVISNNRDKAIMTASVKGYTFYLVAYNEINSLRFYCKHCDKTFLWELDQCPVCEGA